MESSFRLERNPSTTYPNMEKTLSVATDDARVPNISLATDESDGKSLSFVRHHPSGSACRDFIALACRNR